MNTINPMRLLARAGPDADWRGGCCRVLQAGVLLLFLVACQDAPFVPPWTPPEPPPPAEPEPPTQPLIAFVSNRDGNPEIYTMREDGSEVRRLTDHPAREQSPSWSPDRRWIAFVSDRDGDEQIYVMRFDGSGVRRLTTGPGRNYSPAWSPDGQKIAFVSERDGNEEIYRMNPDGSGVERLTHHAGRDFDPAWSPDAQKIAFASDREGNGYGLTHLYFMNADGSGVTRLSGQGPSGSPNWDRSPAWSPDGSRIAFVSRASVDGIHLPQVFVINSDGSGRTKLTDTPASSNVFAWQPGWSHDGLRIVFASAREDGETHLYSMKPDGSEITRLTSHPNSYENYGATWSPDGTRLAFASNRGGGWQIYLMNTDGSNVARVANTEGVGLAHWSPEGSRFAFTSGRGGNAEVYVARLDGSGLQNLTNHPASDLFVCWLSNRGQIAFSSDREGSRGLYLIGSDGSGLTRLTSDTLHAAYPHCSPDGSRIVFVRTLSPARSHLVVVDTDGTGETIITPAAFGTLSYPRWSPSGERILYQYNNSVYESSLRTIRPDGSGDQHVAGYGSVGFTTLYFTLSDQPWAPSGSRIVYTVAPLARWIPSSRVYSYVHVTDIASQTGAFLTRPPATGAPPFWSPDGNWVVFTRRSGEYEYPYTHHGELYLSTPDGRTQRRLTYGSSFSAEPAWSR